MPTVSVPPPLTCWRALPMTADFGSFVGIDWSGARGPRQPGIQLAEALPGRAVPRTILAKGGGHWGRDAVHDWLIERATAAEVADAGPLLVGIDFAFAHPFIDEESYYPGFAGSPQDAAALWGFVDRCCQNDPHLYGGAMFAAGDVGDYYLSPKNHGAPRYRSRRRQTELAARASARAPSPTFKAIGADNVATGSMAGMRLIHALRAALGPRLAVWPFDRIDEAGLPRLAMVLVEIFPSYYFHRVGMNPAKYAAADPDFMSAALAGYDSDGVGPDFVPRGNDADEADAMISAAALRWFADQPACWEAPPAAASEGWILGVPAVT